MSLPSFCQIFVDVTQYREILSVAGELGKGDAIGNHRFARTIIGMRVAAIGGL